MNFNSQNLPKLVPNTAGHAYPAPGADVVACAVPGKANFPLPMSWGGGSKEVDVDQKYWITAISPDDIYPNNEFENFYQLIGEVNPDEDERARIIFEFWFRLGHCVTLYRATKSKPVKVVGVIDEVGMFDSNEGPVIFTPGDILLESPENAGQMWRIHPNKFAKMYDEHGIRPGPILQTA